MSEYTTVTAAQVQEHLSGALRVEFETRFTVPTDSTQNAMLRGSHRPEYVRSDSFDEYMDIVWTELENTYLTGTEFFCLLDAVESCANAWRLAHYKNAEAFQNDALAAAAEWYGYAEQPSGSDVRRCNRMYQAVRRVFATELEIVYGTPWGAFHSVHAARMRLMDVLSENGSIQPPALHESDRRIAEMCFENGVVPVGAVSRVYAHGKAVYFECPRFAGLSARPPALKPSQTPVIRVAPPGPLARFVGAARALLIPKA